MTDEAKNAARVDAVAEIFDLLWPELSEAKKKARRAKAMAALAGVDQAIAAREMAERMMRV